MSNTVHAGDEAPPKTAFQKYLNLSTLDDVMEFYNEVIQVYVEAGISERNMRAIVYALNGLHSYWKLKKDVEVIERLDRIEERLDAQSKN